jgi:hypothetical protein
MNILILILISPLLLNKKTINLIRVIKAKINQITQNNKSFVTS